MTTSVTNSQTERLGCIGIGLRILIGFVIFLVIIGIVGLIYEAWAEATVKAQFPAPGQIMTVDGRPMHIHCVGNGTPTVILDAGQGGWSSDWAAIMPELSQHSRVCAYDRAGYGWSGSADDERTPQQAADDLAGLLTVAQIESPYLLVGFSHAGLANRLFAAQHADEMAGLILVDPATEYDNEILGAEMLQQQRGAVGLFKSFGLLARLGLIRLLGPEGMAGYAPFIATAAADPKVYYTFVANPQWWDTSVQEFESRLNDANLTLVRAQGQIPNIPLIIIASDTLEVGGNMADSMQAARHERMSLIAAQSTHGEFIVAEDSTHNVLIDRPDVVIQAIRSIQVQN
ncbi:MAG: alpha/beta hydrolase [Caldilineaceae bacterium]|nr:alpha/beta hydrolase [Caldilineaceae bacterium]